MKDWTLSWGDNSWSDADLTGAHLSLIAVGTGRDDWEFSPDAGPVRLLAVLAAFIAVAEHRDYVSVVAELQHASALELVGALSITET